MMWMVGLPDYSGTKHAVVGPFPSENEARKWAVATVSNRAFFVVPATPPADYRVLT